MELVNRPHARNLVRWAESRPEVLVLSADLTSSCEADDFRDTYPDRFFSVGMAEQNMMGFAAGLIPAYLMQLACMHAPAHNIYFHLAPVVGTAVIGALLGTWLLRRQD